MPLEDLPGKIVPFKLRVYQAVNARFGPIIEQKLGAGKFGDPWWGLDTGDATNSEVS